MSDSSHTTLRRIDRRTWPLLALGLFLALVVPLSFHVVMIQVIGVPYPSREGIATFVLWLNELSSACALLVAIRLAAPTLKPRPWWLRCLAVFVFYAMLRETARVIFMNGFVTTAYAYNLLTRLPDLVTLLLLCSAIVGVGLSRLPWWAKAASTAAVSAAVYFTIGPWLTATLALDQTFAHLAHDPVYGFPYGWQVELASYVSFVEPVLVIFPLYFILGPHLGDRRWTRVARFVLLVLLLRGRLVSFALFGAFSKLGFGQFLIADSQFLMEWLALALIAAVTIEQVRARSLHAT